MKVPEVSVLMTVFNGERYIHETIDSVLRQTLSDFEFIIIDDGSNDRTREIIQGFRDSRIVYQYQSNAGVAAASNAGLALVKSGYVARIDADDVCLPERLRLQYDFLTQNPDHVFCGSRPEIMDQDGNYIFTPHLPEKDEEIRPVLERENCFVHASAFFRTDAARKIGGYPEAIKFYFNDYVFLYQLSKIGKVYNFQQPLVRYRLVPFSISLKIRDQRYRSILKNIVHKGTAEQSEIDYLTRFQNDHNLNKKDKVFNYYILLAKLYRIEANSWGLSLFYLRKAFLVKPLAISYLASAILQIINPVPIVKFVRKRFY